MFSSRPCHRPGLAVAASLFALFVALPASNAASSIRLQTEARTFISLFEEAHYARRNVSDLSPVAADFLAQLDSEHMILLAPEADKLIARYRDKLIWSLRTAGDWSAAEALDLAYLEQSRQRMDWVLQRLDHDFDLSTDQTYSPERSQARWPENQTAADELWLRRLKAELIEEMLNGSTLDQARTALRARYRKRRETTTGLPADELVERLLTAVAHRFDPHSTYYSAATRAAGDESSDASRRGLGLVLAARSGGIFVEQVMPGGPAARAGTVHVGDRILSVAESGAPPVAVDGLSLRQVTQLMSGKEGTVVTVELQPADSSDPALHTRAIATRGTVDPAAMRADAFVFGDPSDPRTPSIGVIKITSLYGALDFGDGKKASASSDVASLLAELHKASVGFVVLDLRGNGGGYLSEAINIAGLFVGRGPILQVKNYNGDVQVTSSDRKEPVYKDPTVVLVDEATASGAEIIAGTLQDYGRAVVVGPGTTVGIGTVQTVLDMRNLVPSLAASKEATGLARITIQEFFLPDGRSPQLVGVRPDIIVPNLNPTVALKESDLFNPLPAASIQPLHISGRPMAAPLLDFLRRQNAERCSQAAYVLAEQRAAHRRERRTQPLSLNLETRRRQIETERQSAPSPTSSSVGPPPPHQGVTPQIHFVLQGGSTTPAATPPAPSPAGDLLLLEAMHIGVDLIHHKPDTSP